MSFESASNKILILASSAVIVNNDAGYYTIYRDSTNLGSTFGMGAAYDGASGAYGNIGFNYLDSPNTTSAITYQVYFRANASQTAQLQLGPVKGSITCLEVKG